MNVFYRYGHYIKRVGTLLNFHKTNLKYHYLFINIIRFNNNYKNSKMYLRFKIYNAGI